MLRFVVHRLLWAVPVLWLSVTLIFFLMRAIGGNPFRHGRLLGLSTPGEGWVKYGDPQPEAIADNLARRYQLDLPWHEQYLNYLEGVATFNFGLSFSFRQRTVDDILVEHGVVSLELMALAFALALVVGIPTGIVASLRPGSAADYAARLFAGAGYALPTFLVGTLLIYLFSVRLGVLPTSGWSGTWKHKLLPVITLAVIPMAYCIRLVRGSMLEVLQQDYIRAARAKGLRAYRVVMTHALKNSLIPTVTVLGPLIGFMMTSLFVVEVVFAVPGIARNFIAAAGARDLPVVMAITVALTVVIVVANTVIDLALGALDPRMREAA